MQLGACHERIESLETRAGDGSWSFCEITNSGPSGFSLFNMRPLPPPPLPGHLFVQFHLLSGKKKGTGKNIAQCSIGPELIIIKRGKRKKKKKIVVYIGAERGDLFRRYLSSRARARARVRGALILEFRHKNPHRRQSLILYKCNYFCAVESTQNN